MNDRKDAELVGRPACLTPDIPDITEAILAGRQPRSFSLKTHLKEPALPTAGPGSGTNQAELFNAAIFIRRKNDGHATRACFGFVFPTELQEDQTTHLLLYW